MERLNSKYITAHPIRRPLRIFASDPMQARNPGNRITIEIQNEEVESGPKGSRIEVIDYDGARGCFYPPVDLNDKDILMLNGLEPAESDPRFHQQMVYAIAMRTLENFEYALGRPIEFYKSKTKPRLRLFPHAFYGANAYFDPGLNAILFGYFCADPIDPGPNLPGQIVYTCLSHDIIVHEFTHAVVNRLRKNFIEPTNPDVLAFHEGFADIVALLQHFTFQDILTQEIQKTHAKINTGKSLIELAQQFGYATGANQALRSAINTGSDAMPKRLSPVILEVHERGSILVAAVFEAFFNIYQRRIQDLIRIATSGTGILPSGDMHPDLVNRVAKEASQTAKSILNMCIRAFDYMPPVDITFGDYLRALVTTDYELYPADENGLRGAMIEAFRARGIYPEKVVSLAEESLIWEEPIELPWLDPEKIKWTNEFYTVARNFRPNIINEDVSQKKAPTSSANYKLDNEDDPDSYLAKSLHKYAMENARNLDLDPEHPIQVSGFHTSFRVTPTGQLQTELVVQFTQKDDTETEKMGGIPLRGGTTIVVGTDGRIRYLISKPLPSASLREDARKRGEQRLDRQRAYLAATDLKDPQMAYGDQNYLSQRSKMRMRISALHQGVNS
ncbi:MAG: hypothetical protein C0410_03810 [Anaerolinea sp.]|nr:hypothetical protein [Anaerolinea sp.]